MALELRGVDALIKKLDKLKNIDTTKVINEVADETAKAIQSEAKKVSNTSYMYAGKVEVRNYGLSCFIDVGFSSAKEPFENWKSLWFQNWGFRDYGLNFRGQYFIANYQNWFTDAVNSNEKQIINKIKIKAKKQITEGWK